MLVLHAIWSGSALCLWAEAMTPVSTETGVHPHAVDATTLRRALVDDAGLDDDALDRSVELRLRLPAEGDVALPSDDLLDVTGDERDTVGIALADVTVPAVALTGGGTVEALLRLSTTRPRGFEYAHALRYWFAVADFLTDLLEDQRFVPTLLQAAKYTIEPRWQPWIDDESARARVAILLAAMPPVTRAASPDVEPWRILDDALMTLTDRTVRAVLHRDDYHDAIEGRDPESDPHVAWLSGLLGAPRAIDPPAGTAATMLRGVRDWISQLDETADRREFRLCFRLGEPDLDAPGDPAWPLTLHLVSAGGGDLVIDADRIWRLPPGGQMVDGHRVKDPHDLLLRELARASRLYDTVEVMLAQPAPTGTTLTTDEAYEFLRETRHLLEESGFDTVVPEWWSDPSVRLGVRLTLEPIDGTGRSSEPGTSDPGAETALGLQTLVRYRWQVAVGDTPLSMEAFQQLMRGDSPLVRIDNRWIEIRADDIARARELLASEGGEMTLLEALRLAHDIEGTETGLPVLGLEASGWVTPMLDANGAGDSMPLCEQPSTFRGSLRPYQVVGLSWLRFLESHGLGACLADDMGLGKTIQLISLMLAERLDGSHPGPTLLIMPTSVLGNWAREVERFAPGLKYHMHHGLDRLTGAEFAAAARESAVVMTTYALVSRDFDSLNEVDWHRIVLDEAQYVKNPPTKQATAIRTLRAKWRIAMTGTPVENRLSELWSIMDFCNPGYLGTPGEFRRKFGIPIERHRNPRQAATLRGLVRPFILRRLKTDPDVLTDLPACVETKEYAHLTPEQATQYQRLVDAMLDDVDRAEGIQRRGLVLATLVKLKQACNHPALLLRENPEAPTSASAGVTGDLSARSGKSHRLMTMLEEVLATGDHALIFTQFRQMGHLLRAMIRHDLDCDPLLLHGGTPAAKRQQMIDRFQDRDGTAPIFILSLRAGGVGLNLTAANHVFHFDRWWNPAVEKQATDRAFRIGQTRTVHVHKFVCVGTLEERIDQMIEQKTELAENIIGSGEDWLTSLSTTQLRDMLALRHTAMEGDG